MISCAVLYIHFHASSLSVATATPLNVAARRTAPTSILVSWTAPTPAPVGYEVFYWRIASSNQHNGGTVTGTSTTVPVQDFSPLTVEVVAFGGMLPSRSNTTTVAAGKPWHGIVCLNSVHMMLVCNDFIFCAHFIATSSMFQLRAGLFHYCTNENVS